MGFLSDWLSNRWLTLYLPAVAVPVIISGTIYAAVQQNYRSNADDPQIQIAQDIAGQLTTGTATVSQLVPSGTSKTDLRTGLDNFLIVYDSTGKMVASSAQLDGNVPQMPSGVFAAATSSSPDIFTWQPASGVREATVVMPFTSSGQKGFIAVGRSLKLVEQRESNLFWMCAACFVVLELLVVVVIAHLELGPGSGNEDEEVEVDADVGPIESGSETGEG